MKLGTKIWVLLGIMVNTNLMAEHLDDRVTAKNSPQLACEDEDNTETKFKTPLGDFSSCMGAYYQRLNNRGADLDQDEFGNGYGVIHFESTKWQNLQLGVTFIGNLELQDNETYEDNIQDSTALAELWLGWDYEGTSIKVGRQQLEWILLEDYFQGVTIDSAVTDDLTLKLAWGDEQATLDPDDFSDFDKIVQDEDGDDTDGVYGAELTWTIMDGLDLSGVYYRANGAFRQYGAQMVFEKAWNDQFATTTQLEYYQVDNNGNHGLADDDNGSLWHIGQTFSVGTVTFGGGYIRTGDQVGTGGILNNAWDPFDEDNLEELVDAKAWYGLVDWQATEAFTVGTVFGIKDYKAGDVDVSAHEIDLITSYAITDAINLEAAVIFVDTKDDVKEDFTKFWTHISYSF